MKLDNFRLLVSDFSASLHFWREIVGLSLIFKDQNNTYAYFDAGNTRIEMLDASYFAGYLPSAPTGQGTSTAPRAAIVFQTDDVDATYADLVKRGATPLAPPQVERAGFARIALLAAPDGYVLEIFTTLGKFPKESES
ncbi:hypothetical protein EPA93_06800 [Ktedonosporobacter rubrisoli]|uniref:VOC domain-containing protein n=1 Tax=Ktedonosporobacter rubrisoli TaxID=2509675 RepID=A0A4P6JL44_KTERU|nr:VOC family protein [Ktedonosporobacter rubrisoli]QBD75730.1 hypothetical protein EPA93_06800 [Ktedonosporobacter rubrisoli]